MFMFITWKVIEVGVIKVLEKEVKNSTALITGKISMKEKGGN